MKLREKIGCILMAVGIVALLWVPLSHLIPEKKPIASFTERYNNWTDTANMLLYDLHEGDVVTCKIGHIDGLFEVWIENENGERIAMEKVGGTRRLVVAEQGHYLIRVKGEHAHASITVSIYSDE